MFPLSTKGGGKSLAFPDVCKVPAPPGPPVPTPFPNTAQCADATKDTCTQRVKILNKPVLHKGSEIASTSGDESGTLKGMVSNTVGDKAGYRSSTAKVRLEGNEAVGHLQAVGHNGANPNVPPGVQVDASQAKVVIG